MSNCCLSWLEPFVAYFFQHLPYITSLTHYNLNCLFYLEIFKCILELNWLINRIVNIFNELWFECFLIYNFTTERWWKEWTCLLIEIIFQEQLSLMDFLSYSMWLDVCEWLYEIMQGVLLHEILLEEICIFWYENQNNCFRANKTQAWGG